MKQHYGGKAPFGYKWNDDKLEIDRQKSKYLLELFNRASLGVNYSTLAELLNKQNIKTSSGKNFTRHSIMHILQNKFYIGILETKNGEIKI